MSRSTLEEEDLVSRRSLEEEEDLVSRRSLEPRRRWASESSISFSSSMPGSTRYHLVSIPGVSPWSLSLVSLPGLFLVSLYRSCLSLISTLSLSDLFPLSSLLCLPPCGKGKPALVRRSTVDDKSELIACIQNGNFARAARIAAGRMPGTLQSLLLFILSVMI